MALAVTIMSSSRLFMPAASVTYMVIAAQLVLMGQRSSLHPGPGDSCVAAATPAGYPDTRMPGSSPRCRV